MQKHNLTPEADLRQPSDSKASVAAQLATTAALQPARSKILSSWQSVLLPDGYCSGPSHLIVATTV